VFTRRVRGERYRSVDLCVRGRRHAIRLGLKGECFADAEVGNVALAGSFVAYSLNECTPGGIRGGVFARRARGGRTLRVINGGPDAALGNEHTTSIEITDLVLGPGGSIAWIVRISDEAGQQTGTVRYQVRRAEGRRGSTLIAGSGGIAPDSLALAGSTLYWTDGGVPRSARLP
jgi:hypothetical protein